VTVTDVLNSIAASFDRSTLELFGLVLIGVTLWVAMNILADRSQRRERSWRGRASRRRRHRQTKTPSDLTALVVALDPSERSLVAGDLERLLAIHSRKRFQGLIHVTRSEVSTSAFDFLFRAFHSRDEVPDRVDSFRISSHDAARLLRACQPSSPGA